MKRVAIPLTRFLKDLLPESDLSSDERALLSQVRNASSPAWAQGLLRQLLESLLERGALVLLGRQEDGRDELLTLRDPTRRLRFTFRLPLASIGPRVRRVSLPLDPPATVGLRHQQVQELLSLQSSLITSGRVMGPRDLVARFPQILREQLPADRADFHAVEMPPGDEWPNVPWLALPADRADLEVLARDRDHVLIMSGAIRGPASLFIGVGDETTGWRGVLQIESGGPDPFPHERIALALLLAQHFRGLLSTLVRLQGLIFYDYLTGIYNRTYFEDQLERELSLARRRASSMALLIVDIDDFKSFNTRYGYDGGDRVLATVAVVLKSALRATDTLARYGGEEFGVILAAPVPIDEARRIAERLRLAVEEEPLQIKDLSGQAVRERVTVSIGVALHPEGGKTPRDLWSVANLALLEAKSRGKNQVRFNLDSD